MFICGAANTNLLHPTARRVHYDDMYGQIENELAFGLNEINKERRNLGR
jgi:hypothetical protein